TRRGSSSCSGRSPGTSRGYSGPITRCCSARSPATSWRCSGPTRPATAALGHHCDQLRLAGGHPGPTASTRAHRLPPAEVAGAGLPAPAAGELAGLASELVRGTHVAGLFGSSRELLVRRIVDPGKSQPVRGRDRTVPLPATQQLSGPVHLTPSVAHEQQNTNQAAHHRVAERIRRHVDAQHVLVGALPPQLLQFADRRPARTLLAEGREVVEPQ